MIRLLWWASAVWQIAMVSVTFVTVALLMEPFAGGGSVGAATSWVVWSLVLSVPYILAFAFTFLPRQRRWMWIPAAVYGAVSGILGGFVDISVVTNASSTAAVGIFLALIVQLCVAGPLVILISFLVRRARVAQSRPKRILP